jgi:hypothetical protein
MREIDLPWQLLNSFDRLIEDCNSPSLPGLPDPISQLRAIFGHRSARTGTRPIASTVRGGFSSTCTAMIATPPFFSIRHLAWRATLRARSSFARPIVKYVRCSAKACPLTIRTVEREPCSHPARLDNRRFEDPRGISSVRACRSALPPLWVGSRLSRPGPVGRERLPLGHRARRL